MKRSHLKARYFKTNTAETLQSYKKQIIFSVGCKRTKEKNTIKVKAKQNSRS